MVLRYIEPMLAMGTFAASSLFSLLLAFVLDPSLYGLMMTWQAAILIVSSILTTRTYELFFHLQSKHDVDGRSAFRASLKIEIVSSIAIVAICTAGAFFAAMSNSHIPETKNVAILASLIAFGTMQGSSVAWLRYTGQWSFVAAADFVCILTWGAALIILILSGIRDPLTLLLLNGLAQGVRAASLFIACAITFDRTREFDDRNEAPTLGKVLRFVFGGQITNALKNGSTSFETIIVAAFFGPVAVALYRIARALIGLPTAALNVLLQKSYPALTQSAPGAERKDVQQKLAHRSVKVALLLYPVAAGVGVIYAIIKPEVDLIQFQLILAVCYLTLIPAAQQQAAFVLLSVNGEHAALSLGYIVAFVFLLFSVGLLTIFPSLTIFLLSVFGAAVIRAWIINRSFLRTQIL
jgi:O-antigen/teichoic acid export membrane protein